jgi:hypothetical protein
VEKAKASRTDTAQALDETKRSEYEEVVVGWQQKLFNQVRQSFLYLLFNLFFLLV